MASLIVWLCVHVSKFNTVCVVEHRGGIRAAEQQQSTHHTKKVSVCKKSFITTGIVCPHYGGHNSYAAIAS